MYKIPQIIFDTSNLNTDNLIKLNNEFISKISELSSRFIRFSFIIEQNNLQFLSLENNNFIIKHSDEFYKTVDNQEPIENFYEISLENYLNDLNLLSTHGEFFNFFSLIEYKKSLKADLETKIEFLKRQIIQKYHNLNPFKINFYLKYEQPIDSKIIFEILNLKNVDGLIINNFDNLSIKIFEDLKQ